MIATQSEALEARSAAAGEAVKRSYVQRMFSDIAPRYDLCNSLLSFGLHGSWRRRALGELGWESRPDGTYLDLCAGTLDVAAALARAPGFRGGVIGADFAEPMLRYGRQKAAGLHISPLVGDAVSLPLRARSCAGAIVAFGIRNVEDLDGALAEVARVLAPGARFVILEFTRPRARFFRIGYELYCQHILPVIGRLLSGHQTAYRYLPDTIVRFPKPGALAERLKGAGFTDVRWTELMFGAVVIHVGSRAA